MINKKQVFFIVICSAAFRSTMSEIHNISAHCIPTPNISMKSYNTKDGTSKRVTLKQSYSSITQYYSRVITISSLLLLLLLFDRQSDGYWRQYDIIQACVYVCVLLRRCVILLCSSYTHYNSIYILFHIRSLNTRICAVGRRRADLTRTSGNKNKI